MLCEQRATGRQAEHPFVVYTDSSQDKPNGPRFFTSLSYCLDSQNVKAAAISHVNSRPKLHHNQHNITMFHRTYKLGCQQPYCLGLFAITLLMLKALQRRAISILILVMLL